MNIDVLAISGSLRADSYNTWLARAAADLSPDEMRVDLYDGLRSVPPFDEDQDTDSPPAPVADLRRRIGAADALLVVTPEFNYSVPGVLKNAIDWASRAPGQETPVLTGKPTAIMGAAPTNFGTVRAQLALRQMFVWTDTPVVVKPEVMVLNAQDRFGPDGRLHDEQTVILVQGLLAALAGLVERERRCSELWTASAAT